jgi:hypothetical protein
MSFKDIADIIKKLTGEDKQVNKPEKSKDSLAFELFLQGKQSVEVAIELDMPADQVEELHIQYWRLSNLDNLEIMYYETKYSLPMLLQLHNKLKEKRIMNLPLYSLMCFLRDLFHKYFRFLYMKTENELHRLILNQCHKQH